MDESEKALFQEIAVNYGDHDGLVSLKDMLLGAQSMARRLQAVAEYEGIADEHDAALVALELGERLDSYATEQLPDLTGMTIMTEAARFVSRPPEVIHISVDESGNPNFGEITLKEGMSIIGQYGGLDFEVRDTGTDYVVRPMIIIDTPSLSYPGQSPHIFSDGGYIMVPLDCDAYEYTGLRSGEEGPGRMQAVRDDEPITALNVEQLIKTCEGLEDELNNGTYSDDTYARCYDALQCYLDENGFAQDSEIDIVMVGTSLAQQDADPELVDSPALVEKPSISNHDGAWRIQLQFSVRNRVNGDYILYGVSPRNILSVNHK